MDEDDFSQLPAAAQAYIRSLEARNQELGMRVSQLEEQFRLAQNKRFAPSSEKALDRRFDEAECDASQDPVASGEESADQAFGLPNTGLPPAPQRTTGKLGRKPLPADLPRERIEYDLPDDQKACTCCGHALHRMGEDVSEQLHIAVKASVRQHVRFKYGCRHCASCRALTCDHRADAYPGVAGQ